MIWKIDWKRFHRQFLLVLACVIQLACSGGGGGDDAATSQLPAPDNRSTPDPNNIIPTRHLVEISYFGEGSLVINGDGGSIRCESGGLCTGRVEQGTTIVVEAIEAADHQFDGWQNCGTTIGARCTATIDKDTLLLTAFRSRAPLKYHDDVIFLSVSEIAAITGYDSETGILIFGVGTDISRLTTGSVIISNGAPDNVDSLNDMTFSRRIESIVALTGSSTIVQTIPVTIADIIAEGTFVYKDTLKAEELAGSMPEGMSIRKNDLQALKLNIIPLDLIEVVVADEDGDHSTTHDQVKITGQLDLDLSFEGYIGNRKLGYIYPETRIITNLKSTSSLSVIFGKEAKIHKEKIEITKLFWPDITVEKSLSIFLVFEITASGKIEPKVEWVHDFTGGFHHFPGEPTRFFGSREQVPANFDVELSAELKGKFGIELKPAIKVLWVVEGGVGVYPHVGMSIEAKVSQDKLEDTRCEFDPKVFFGIEAYASANFSLIKKLSAEVRLLKIEYPISIEGLSAICSFPDITPPASPADLYLNRREINRIELGWHAAVDEGGVGSYTVYRDDELLVDDVPGYLFMDVGLSSGTEYCYDVVAVDNAGNKSDRSEPPLCVTTLQRDNTPPTNPENVSVSPLTASSILITWEEANDNTSVEIYLISKASANSHKSYVIGESQGSELRVTGLSSDTEYCYFVSAVDLFGNVSLPSRTVCGRTHGAQYANWVMRSACIGSNYLFEQGLDIDESASSTISFTKTWSDYDGKTLGGAFNGSYDIATSVLTGELLYSAEGNSYTRRDGFSVSLASSDTGDIPTTTSWIGPDGSSLTCDTVVRFTRSDQSRQIQQAMHGQQDANVLNALP